MLAELVKALSNVMLFNIGLIVDTMNDWYTFNHVLLGFLLLKTVFVV